MQCSLQHLQEENTASLFLRQDISMQCSLQHLQEENTALKCLVEEKEMRIQSYEKELFEHGRNITHMSDVVKDYEEECKRLKHMVEEIEQKRTKENVEKLQSE